MSTVVVACEECNWIKNPESLTNPICTFHCQTLVYHTITNPQSKKVPMPIEADAVIDAIDRIRRRQNVPKIIHEVIDTYRASQPPKVKSEYPLLHAINEACKELGM